MKIWNLQVLKVFFFKMVHLFLMNSQKVRILSRPTKLWPLPKKQCSFEVVFKVLQSDLTEWSGKEVVRWLSN